MLNFNPASFKKPMLNQASLTKKRGVGSNAKISTKPTINQPIKFSGNSGVSPVQHGLNNLKQGWPYLLAFVAFSSGIAIFNPVVIPLIPIGLAFLTAVKFTVGIITKTPG